ncbi:hypothetical protein [Streptomyces sp. NRRL WC-3742]|uniref:hypothetical protein n=1 Tax=Streptomyces sp. NRRL WC-3742 TaxID=1463934 RepID=UPI0004C47E6C|nr:hypothetical protein [Streptomyces sp. NRRL WC-3742]
MRRKASRPRALGGAAVLLAALCACAGPGQYFDGTGLHDAAAAEVTGTWEGAEQTRLTLDPAGTALVQRLDGKEFDFDAGWRVTGTGTWELTDRPGGQNVVVTMTARTALDRRADAPTGASSSAAPLTYTWRFNARRDARRSLELFFFFGDPDSGNTYLLRHAAV